MYLSLSKFYCAALAACALAVNTPMALAQHSDIEFEYHDGAVEVEFGPEGRVFESDFVGGLDGDFATDDPGFETHDPIGANDIIGFNVLGPLTYHDGTDFAATSETLTVIDALTTSVPVDSSTTSASGVVAQADGAGVIHDHIDFEITPTAPTGAYGLLVSLSSFESDGVTPTGIADSAPFYIVFSSGWDLENNLADAELFEGAVEAFAARVPEPASLALIGAAGMFGLIRRRRKQ